MCVDWVLCENVYGGEDGGSESGGGSGRDAACGGGGCDECGVCCVEEGRAGCGECGHDLGAVELEKGLCVDKHTHTHTHGIQA